MKKSIIVVILLIICASSLYVFKEQAKFSAQLLNFIHRNCSKTEICEIDIREITNFKWDKFYYFSEGVTLDDKKYEPFSYVDHGLADHQIIFVKDDTIVYSERLKTGIEKKVKNEVTFDYNNFRNVQEYIASDSLFQVEKRPIDGQGYFKKESYYFNLKKIDK